MSDLVSISQRSSPKANALNIIFIHGLNGDAFKTWMSDPHDQSTLWPKWLSKELGVSTWSFRYDAQLSSWLGDILPITETADTLLETLTLTAELKNQSILLIGHSMGGIIAKQAIVNAQTKNRDRYQPLIDSIRGLVFLATPHSGSDLANLATALKFPIRTSANVRALHKNDPNLKNLNQQFHSTCSERKLPVRAFSEAKGVYLGKSILGIRFGKRLKVVETSSSDFLHENALSISVSEDHFSIAKPKNRQSLVYKNISSFVSELGWGAEAIKLNGARGIDPKILRIFPELSLQAKNSTLHKDLKALSESEHYPGDMVLNGRLVPNPIWKEGVEIPNRHRNSISDRILGSMLLATRDAQNTNPELLCYWSHRWNCYLVPFYRMEAMARPTPQILQSLNAHAESEYGGIVTDTGKRMISIKPNIEYPSENWVYCFSFFDLLLPDGYKESSEMAWLTLDRLAEPGSSERAANGDVIRAIRDCFSVGLHNLQRSNSMR